jgi:hypothetical protein
MLKFEVVNHGKHHSQYFQGCGVAFTKFTHVATGAGDSEYAAGEDALDQFYADGPATNALDNIALREAVDALSHKPDVHDDCETTKKGHEDCEVYYYVSLRWVEG